MTVERFQKTKPDGSPLTCKFCGRHVWFDPSAHRYYEVDGKRFHIRNCSRGIQYYRNENLLAAEEERKTWEHPLDRRLRRGRGS